MSGVCDYLYHPQFPEMDRQKGGKDVCSAGVYEKCRELFPIEKITFQGKEFTRGMRVKVTTQHENIIEGELIGMNKMNLVCIRTNSQIIAHQLEKIQEIRSI